MDRIRWITPSKYKQWQVSPKDRSIKWIGIVHTNSWDRRVVIRAVQSYSSLLITAHETKDITTGYKYDGKPRIKITCSGSIILSSRDYKKIEEACQIALKRYVTEFLQVKDLENT